MGLSGVAIKVRQASGCKQVIYFANDRPIRGQGPIF